MTKPRRKHDEEFKKRAVQMTYQKDRTIQSTAEGLGIHPSLLQKWRTRYGVSGEKTEKALQDDEIRGLQRRISELEEENDLLKKASAYFAALQRNSR